MRQFLLLLICGFALQAQAQTATPATSGNNPDPTAPVNISVPSQRPAQPAMFQSVPVQHPGQFYIKNDKPVTPFGEEIPAQVTSPAQSKQEQARAAGYSSAPSGNTQSGPVHEKGQTEKQQGPKNTHPKSKKARAGANKTINESGK